MDKLISVFLIALLGFNSSTKASITKKIFNMHDIEFTDIDNKSNIAFRNLKGKLIMVVNTASKCGFTNQYEDLEKIWNKYKDRGLIIIGVPSNDFGNQEPDDNNEIKNFCTINFGVTFPLTTKVHVSGEDAHIFFQRVRENLGLFAAPKWNFYKYFVSKDGKLISWFSSTTKPNSKKIIEFIEKNLP